MCPIGPGRVGPRRGAKPEITPPVTKRLKCEGAQWTAPRPGLIWHAHIKHDRLFFMYGHNQLNGPRSWRAERRVRARSPRPCPSLGVNCRRHHLEANFRPSIGWTGLLEVHGSLVEVLVETVSRGDTGASCWSWRAICGMSSYFCARPQCINQPVAQTARGQTCPPYLESAPSRSPRSCGVRALIRVCATG